MLPESSRLVVLRPFNHIGAGQDERFAIASFAGRIARIEAGLSRPVLDVAAVYVTLICGTYDLPIRFVFNVALGVARPISELLDGLHAEARVPFKISTASAPARPWTGALASQGAGSPADALDYA